MKELNRKDVADLIKLNKKELQEELRKVDAALFLAKMKHVSYELKQVHLLAEYKKYRAQIVSCLQNIL